MTTMLDVARARDTLQEWIEHPSWYGIDASPEDSKRFCRWRRSRVRLDARLAAVPANADRLLRDADRRVHNFECAVDGGALRKLVERAETLARALKQTQLAYVAEYERLAKGGVE